MAKKNHIEQITEYRLGIADYLDVLSDELDIHHPEVITLALIANAASAAALLTEEHEGDFEWAFNHFASAFQATLKSKGVNLAFEIEKNEMHSSPPPTFTEKKS